ncbi:MAG TPA: helix-hairpin-helix domain-containing protein [Azospirillum sp.]|nr:helix-hairpin-helix domain-containing protein [Azospirillum sp.]
MPTKTSKTTGSTKQDQPKKTVAPTKTTKAKTTKAATAKQPARKTVATKTATSKATAPKAAPKRPAKAAPQSTISDTVRAVVDTAAAIVGAAMTVHGAATSSKKGGKTARKVGRALEVASGLTAAATALVDLNRAAPKALEGLKHIGPKRARKIVEARPFTSVDDLVTRKLLPKKAVEELRERLSVSRD